MSAKKSGKTQRYQTFAKSTGLEESLPVGPVKGLYVATVLGENWPTVFSAMSDGEPNKEHEKNINNFISALSKSADEDITHTLKHLKSIFALLRETKLGQLQKKDMNSFCQSFPDIGNLVAAFSASPKHKTLSSWTPMTAVEAYMIATQEKDSIGLWAEYFKDNLEDTSTILRTYRKKYPAPDPDHIARLVTTYVDV